MPTYEYRCKSCDQELDVVQSFTDDALTTCEACGGQLRKVFGNVGIAFKGSGFYKNDSRGKSSAAVASADKGGESISSNGDKNSNDKNSSDKNSSDKNSSDTGSTASKDTGSATKQDAAPAASTSTSSKGDAAKARPKSA